MYNLPVGIRILQIGDWHEIWVKYIVGHYSHCLEETLPGSWVGMLSHWLHKGIIHILALQMELLHVDIPSPPKIQICHISWETHGVIKTLDWQTLSNSSIHTTPPSANTIAPPSITKFLETGSLMTDAVSPAALLPLPDVYTPIGATFSTNFSSWLLAVPGSPSSSTLMSPRRVKPSGSLRNGDREWQVCRYEHKVEIRYSH